jgi:hypothetical protein
MEQRVGKRKTFNSPCIKQIGICENDNLDRILFWTTADLEAKLIDFQHYYNGHRTHAALEGRLPEPPAGGVVTPTGLGSYRWRRHCRVVPNSDGRLIL